MIRQSMFTLAGLQSRAATAENPRGLPGCGGQARGGRKGSPCAEHFVSGQVLTLLDTAGPGRVRRIWMTVPTGHYKHMRSVILRMYWDGQSCPSVEVPIGDFFGLSHGVQTPTQSALCFMQDGRGLNCLIQMPFRRHARITIENDSDEEVSMLFYEIDYTLGDEVTDDDGYFHAQFRRSNPCALGEDYVLLDGVEGRGVYLGTVLGIRNRFAGHFDEWWGEGEFKFYIDGDDRYPTICGTGLEDYVGSGWGTDATCTPYQGAPVVDDRRGLYSLYRWHLPDPIYFGERLRVTVQQIGAGRRAEAEKFYGEQARRYQAVGCEESSGLCLFDRSDDYASVAYWYQTLPTKPFPALPDRAAREKDLGKEEAE